MAHTAHADPKQVKEHYDSPEVLEQKLDRLEKLVKNSKHMVAFTGAGISTSAGISDFRGPLGVWTLKAQGKQPMAGTPAVRALPTKTHMALVQLQRQQKLKYLISQNCDGLHRRSGIPATAISELHGNGNIEICEDCGQRFFRDFKCDRRIRTFDHFTGRFCHCQGRLLNSTIDFGQSLPSLPLKRATAESRKADLHIVLGSSLTVSPACTMPEETMDSGGQLVIVNLQRTPLTSRATLHIHAPTDVVMEMLMKRLAVTIPPFYLERRILIEVSNDTVSAKAVDVHDPCVEIGVLCDVTWKGVPEQVAEGQRAKAIWQHVEHKCSLQNLDVHSLRPTLHFVGHYDEPPMTLNLDVSQGGRDVQISFNPLTGEWSVDDVGSIASRMSAHVDRDQEYGRMHRQYVVDKRREQGSADADKQVEVEFQKSRRLAQAWADEEARGRAQDPASMSRAVARARPPAGRLHAHASLQPPRVRAA